MNNAETWEWVVGYLILALILLAVSWGSIRSRKRQRLIQNIPTSKTAGVFIGLVEVKGTAESENPLTSELAESLCVDYSFAIEEHWRRTVTETYTDSDGKSRTRTRTESGWKTIESGTQSIPFYIKDDTGILQIRPDKAKIERTQMYSQTVRRGDPLYYSRGHHFSVSNSTHRRRFVENGIPLHHELYTIGQSRERQDIAAAEIAHDPDCPMFLISTRPEEKIQKSMAGGFYGLLIFGSLLALGAPWLIQNILIHDESFPVIPAVSTFAVFWIYSFIRWGLMVFNDLIDLKNRVSQAASNIEVQLKRRHDLIPRLLNITRGLKDYESRIQQHIVQLRNQINASIPGKPGTNPEACQQSLIAIAEAYPEIKSDTAFMKLHEGITDAEERIALARNYFNDIVTQYNTRRETFPDQVFASLAGLKHIDLFQADDFIRKSIKVDLAD